MNGDPVAGNQASLISINDDHDIIVNPLHYTQHQVLYLQLKAVTAANLPMYYPI